MYWPFYHYEVASLSWWFCLLWNLFVWYWNSLLFPWYWYHDIFFHPFTFLFCVYVWASLYIEYSWVFLFIQCNTLLEACLHHVYLTCDMQDLSSPTLPLQQKCRVLTTGPPRKFCWYYFCYLFFYCLICLLLVFLFSLSLFV